MLHYKKITTAIALIGAIMSFTHTAYAKTWATLNGKAPLVIGHRGLAGFYPDHTLIGYQKAAEAGADFIEPDLVSTKDGVLIARHEPNLKDTTDISTRPEFAAYKRTQQVDGKAEEGWFTTDLTLAQIKTLRAKQPRDDRDPQYNGQFEIPTFEEVLQLRERLSAQLGREIGVYPETKHPTWFRDQGLPLEEKLLALLDKYHLNRADAPVYIQSFELGNLKDLKAVSPVKRIFLIDGDDVLPDGKVTSGQPYDFSKKGDPRTFGDMLSDDNLREIAQVAQGIGPWKVYIASYTTDAAGVKTRMTPTDLVQRAHAAGLALHPFTFRNEAKHLTASDRGDPFNEYQLYFNLGVDGVFSDYTPTAVSARKRLAEMN